MRQLPASALAALQNRNVTLRDFLWLEGRNRSTGAIVQAGYWSDLGTISAQVLDPRTGTVATRSFKGAGGLVEISAIPMVSNLTVQSVTITISQIADTNDFARLYDLKFARVEVYRGLFAPASLVQLAPAYSRFLGYVDEAPVETPAEGGAGSITLTCVSHSQEMRRRNTATRSDADTRRRDPNDSFNRHAAAVGTWEMLWGRATSHRGG